MKSTQPEGIKFYSTVGRATKKHVNPSDISSNYVPNCTYTRRSSYKSMPGPAPFFLLLIHSSPFFPFRLNLPISCSAFWFEQAIFYYLQTSNQDQLERKYSHMCTIFTDWVHRGGKTIVVTLFSCSHFFIWPCALRTYIVGIWVRTLLGGERKRRPNITLVMVTKLFFFSIPLACVPKVCIKAGWGYSCCQDNIHLEWVDIFSWYDRARCTLVDF